MERNVARPIRFSMNVSWNDLNNVQEPGNYPFRDGTICITFAEVAIWKAKPGALFQLMRKHPIQTAFEYVLGRQVDERSAPADIKLIYESSNGDTWCLTHDPLTGARAVMHRPNPHSGGRVSYIEVDKFLTEGANGPEHQALRLLQEPSIDEAAILIACDIHSPKGEAFDSLVTEIQSLGSWWHHLETTWIVKSVYSPADIRDKLKLYVAGDDQLLVVNISGAAAECFGINEPGSKWLNDNI
jgi:hypothetical protein